MRQKTTSLASDILPLCDVACLLVSALICNLIFSAWLTPTFIPAGNYYPGVFVSILFAPFLLYDQRFGAFAISRPLTPMLRSYVLRYGLFIAIVLSLLLLLLGWTGNTVFIGWLVIWLTLGLLLSLCVRVLVVAKLRRLQNKGAVCESIAVVGAGSVADRLIHALRQSPANTVELVGIFDDEDAVPAIGSAKSHGTLAALIELGNTRNIDWILLTLPPTAEHQILKILQQLQPLSVPIAMCPQDVGLTPLHRDMDYLGDHVPVTVLADQPIKRWNWVIKAGEDYLIGTIATILLLPVLALIALAIKLDSPGPIIFKQRRHTLNNREFDICKFRTMRWEASPVSENLRQTSRNDDRVTAVGRFLRSSSLDELPQLINVFKGDMSLVGPRPHAVNMRTENQLGHEITDQYVHRHRVKPGISGWSQVNGARGATDTIAQLRRRIELDLYYIENWSVLLDLKILMKTCVEVFKRTNAF